MAQTRSKTPSGAPYSRPALTRAEGLEGGLSLSPDARRYRALVSTEAPVERTVLFDDEYRTAQEVLLHQGGAPDLTRLTSAAGIPILRGHNRDVQVGQIRETQVKDGQLFAIFEVYPDTADGREVISQLDSGYGRGISAGYDIIRFTITETDEVDERTGEKVLDFRVHEWGLHEASLVSVPADASAGVLREASATRAYRDATRVLNLGSASQNDKRGNRNMSKDEAKDTPEAGNTPPAAERAQAPPAPLTPPPVDTSTARGRVDTPPAPSPETIKVVADAVREGMSDERQERATTAGIILGEFKDSPKEVQEAVEMRLRNFKNNPDDTERAAVRECHSIKSNFFSRQAHSNAQLAADEGFNVADFVMGAVGNPRGDAAREFSEQHLRVQVGDGMRNQMSANRRSILVPIGVAMGRDLPSARAAFTSVDTTGVAGVTAGTGTADTGAQHGEYRADLYVDALRPDLVLGRLGVRRELTNNNLVYSVQGGVASAVFLGETDRLPDTSWTTSQRTTAPHRYGTRMLWTRLRETLDRLPLANQIARELQRSTAQIYEQAVLTGSGVGDNPQGIFGTPMIGSLAFGTSTTGGAISKRKLLDLELKQQLANIPGPYRILTTPNVASAAQMIPAGVLTAPSEATLVARPLGGRDTILDFPYAVSNLMPRDRTKGTGGSQVTGLHTMLFGDFSEVVVVDYGFVEITYDDLTYAPNNMVQLTYNAWMDVTVRRRTALVAVEDITV